MCTKSNNKTVLSNITKSVITVSTPFNYYSYFVIYSFQYTSESNSNEPSQQLTSFPLLKDGKETLIAQHIPEVDIILILIIIIINDTRLHFVFSLK